MGVGVGSGGGGEEGGGIMFQFPAQFRNASERGDGAQKTRGNENISYSRLECANHDIQPLKKIRIRIRIRIRISLKINNSVGSQKAVF